MAKGYTDQVGVAGIESGAIKPMDTKSPIEMGLDAAGDAMQAWRAQSTIRARDAAAREDSALDNIARTAFKIDVQANNAMIPSSVINAKGQLDNARNAVDQGLVPQVAYQTQLQNAVDRAMADNPEAAYEIANYMRTSGHDHFMFRQLEQEQARSNAISNAVNSADAKALEYARARGTNTSIPVEQQIAAGYTLQKADFDMDMAAKQATSAKLARDAGKQDAEFMMTQANKQGINGVQQWLSGVTMPLYNQFNALISAAGNDEGKLNRLSTEMIPMLDNATNSAIASSQQKLIQMGIATPENMNLVKTQIENMNQGLKAVFSDRSGALAKSVQNLQNQYNIDVTKAAPLIYKYGKLIGYSALGDLLGPTSLVDEELQKRLKLEWQGVAAGGTDATTHFNNIITIMKGDKTLKDFSEPEARAYIGGIVSGKRATEAAIINDGAQNMDKSVYINTYGNLLNATNDFTPASDYKDLKNATNLVFTRPARLAMDKLAADPNTREQAEAMGMASHGESIKMIQNLLQGSEQDQVQIIYDKNKGVFTFKDNQRNPQDRAIARNLSTNYGRVETLNQALDHAVKTSKYDTNLPKGVTPKQLRDAYATNSPIRDKEGKIIANPDELFNKAADKLEDQLRNVPLTLTNQIEQEKIQGIHGAIAHVESGNNPDAVSPVGAVGRMQTMPATLKNPGYGIEPAKDDSDAEKTRVGKQFFDKMVEKYNGRRELALAAYNWGPGNVDEWIKNGAQFSKLPRETREYISSVLLTNAVRGGE